jgi:hypothetical protein
MVWGQFSNKTHLTLPRLEFCFSLSFPLYLCVLIVCPCPFTHCIFALWFSCLSRPGDHITFYNVYRAFEDVTRPKPAQPTGDDPSTSSSSASSSVAHANAVDYTAVGSHKVKPSTLLTPKQRERERRWCEDNFINHRSMMQARDVRHQLLHLYASHGRGAGAKSRGKVAASGTAAAAATGTSATGTAGTSATGTAATALALMAEHDDLMLEAGSSDQAQAHNSALIRKCFLAGFFLHAARRQPDGSYQTLADRQTVHIHPSSALHRRSLAPGCVFYNELVVTTKQYMRDVCAIDERWLPEVAPQAYRAAASAAASSPPSSSSSSSSSPSSSSSSGPKSPSSAQAAGKPASLASASPSAAARVGHASGGKHQSPHNAHNAHGSHGAMHSHARAPIGAVTTAPRRQ